MSILCLDFDGVIHSYTSGWKGADVIPDPPVPGTAEFLEEAVRHFDVAIFSSRSHQRGGMVAMAEYVMELLIKGLGPEKAEEVNKKISYPLEKPPALVTIDDRAITFTGKWPDIETLKNFKPWNK